MLELTFYTIKIWCPIFVEIQKHHGKYLHSGSKQWLQQQDVKHEKIILPNLLEAFDIYDPGVRNP